jgi:hypothetical protein
MYLSSAPTERSAGEYAVILFTTFLQESDAPTVQQIRRAVLRQWAGCRDQQKFAEQLAQEAGDHPEETARRMRWAVRATDRAFGSPHLLIAS